MAPLANSKNTSSYIPQLLTLIQSERINTTWNVKRKTTLSDDHPTGIQPTIGHSGPPSTSDIAIKTMQSRFKYVVKQ